MKRVIVSIERFILSLKTILTNNVDN